MVSIDLYVLNGPAKRLGAPSYFSQFFEEQLRQNPDATNLRTLYIDRDPSTFQEIARHLQGYHIQPKDGPQFVKLFADAQFYNLPRLISQLFESEIFIQIGDRHFQIPRDIFSGPGDSPNFFSLGFAVFFASPSEVFPGLNRKGLLRPPAITPPSVPNRSGDVFAELIHLLRGYPLHIRNDTHRAELLRDCRYFHLRGLEQKLIPHHLSYNPIRERSEIVIRLDDVRQSGLQFADADTDSSAVMYARPFVDNTPNDLIVEIAAETTIIDRSAMRATFSGLTKARVNSLYQILAGKKSLPAQTPSEQGYKIRFDDETDVTVDGDLHTDASHTDTAQTELSGPPPAKRKRVDSSDQTQQRWIVRNGQWRIRVEPQTNADGVDMVFTAVKLDVYTDQKMRNRSRAFLS
ncbi:hypothetical protein ASPWEDRAFT_154138 [Aspergillus wentii DTO 134E9]|uniref:Potassium channel tetramerisation-type BTB domain-containing protein n=1 Tax=Aspergillus wentii DTO 134E9 TaxID=1073089 RepID=A0A1L9RIH0_ASPWE|nr:uncharacterized protein ASPWEDRAFT_154138 [Aspergillus wentii DTO 134E9]OJJ34726.1 hypothetical protein ASPWEDRAFT_154138 [Aspergillus wentii DTO 134E9]